MSRGKEVHLLVTYMIYRCNRPTLSRKLDGKKTLNEGKFSPTKVREILDPRGSMYLIKCFTLIENKRTFIYFLLFRRATRTEASPCENFLYSSDLLPDNIG